MTSEQIAEMINDAADDSASASFNDMCYNVRVLVDYVKELESKFGKIADGALPIDWRKLLLTRLLWDFCSPEVWENGSDMHAPWKVGEWTYATNGRAVIRVDCLNLPDWPMLSKKRPAVEKLEYWPMFATFSDGWEGLVVPIPAFKITEDSEAVITPDFVWIKKNGEPFAKVLRSLIDPFALIPNCEYLCGDKPSDGVLLRFPGGEGVVIQMSPENQETT